MSSNSKRPIDDAPTRTRPLAASVATLSGAFALTVSDGPDKGKTFALDGSRASRVLVGKSPACELRLADPHVSRRHLALDVVTSGLRITDLNSANGTFVNGIRVHDATLHGGELIRLGDSTLSVVLVHTSEPAIVSTAMRFGRVIGQSAEMRRPRVRPGGYP